MRCLAMTRSILILVAILVLSFGLQGCGPFQKYKKAYEIAIEQKNRIEESYAILQSKLAELEEANSKLEEKVVEIGRASCRERGKIMELDKELDRKNEDTKTQAIE